MGRIYCISIRRERQNLSQEGRLSGDQLWNDVSFLLMRKMKDNELGANKNDFARVFVG